MSVMQALLSPSCSAARDALAHLLNLSVSSNQRLKVRGEILDWVRMAHFSQARWASKDMVMMVLPKPISSARMPFRRRVYIVTSQSSPTC